MKNYVVLMLLLLSADLAHGQQLNEDIPHTVDSVEKRTMRSRLQDLIANSSILSDLTNITLNSSTSETDLTAIIGLGVKNSVFNITVNTPVSKKRNEVVNLDGLAKKTSVSFGWLYEAWGKGDVLWKSKALNEAFLQLDKEREGKCCEKAESISQYTLLSKAEKIRFEQIFEYKLRLPFFGVKGKVARNDYDYFLDTALGTTTSATKYDFEIRAFAGIRFTNHQSLAFTAILQNYYDAGDISTFELPFAQRTQKQTDLYEQAPELKTKLNVQLEYRAINKGATIAFNPYVLADFKNKQLEARALFYFFRQKDDDGNFKGLNGGAFVGYRTGKDFKFDTDKANLLIGVFFAGAFDLNSY
jgi:hypothetical protein